MASYKTVIDISVWNPVTDWSSVASAVDGIIIRCGYRGYGSSGTLATDTSFASNIKNAATAGIPLTVYFFSTAITTAEAVEEADYALNLISGYTISMPIFIDSEYSNTSHNGRSDSLSKSDRTTIVKAFCAEIVSKGYLAGVYANDDWFNSNLDWKSIYDSGYSLWVAKYSTVAPVNVTSGYYIAWQYTSTNTFTGINSNVDTSYWYGEIGAQDSDKYYFDTYTGTSGSIITALAAVGCSDTSYSYRSIIATANSIYNYTGTSEQNTTMVNLLKSGLLIDPSGGDTTAPTITVSTNRCGTIVFSVTDDVYVSTVTIDGTSQDLAGSYTYSTDIGSNITIKASDVAGNTATKTATIGDHNYKSVVTAATCTTQGYTTYTCSYCKDSYKANYINALGHDYEDTITDPTCTEGGYTTHVCSRCGDTYTDNETEALGHDYVAVKTVEGTCTTDGYIDYECSRCGDTYTDTTSIGSGHSYSAPTFTWSSDYTTCTATFVCSECGDTQTYDCKVTKSYSDNICEEDGYTYYTATVTVNSSTYTRTESIETSALGHKYTLTNTVAATCTSQGYKEYTCSICGESYKTDYTDALGHDYAATEIVEPTCTTDGYTTYVCSRCNNTKTDDISSAEGHDYTEVVTDPTCTERGYTTKTCSKCGTITVEDYTSPLGHDYILTAYEAATYKETGYGTWCCSRCGDTYTDNYDVLQLYDGLEIQIAETEMYPLPVSRFADLTISGTFYVWDDSVYNDRVKITNRIDNVDLPGLVTGWVDIGDINKIIVGGSTGTKYGLGDAITATKLVLFETASSSTTHSIKTGTLYISDSEVTNKRVPLTDDISHLGDSEYFVGWARVSDL